jgi:hypothetical protein
MFWTPFTYYKVAMFITKLRLAAKRRRQKFILGKLDKIGGSGSLSFLFFFFSKKERIILKEERKQRNKTTSQMSQILP